MRIDINGRIVEVDDSFADLDEAAQGAAVDEIYSQIASEQKPVEQPAQPEPSSLLDRSTDYGKSMAMGVIGLPEAAVGLADIVSKGKVGKWFEEKGVRFEDAKNIIADSMTPEQKAANAAVSNAEGIAGKAKAAIQNPSTIGQAVVQSAPLMLGGAALARTLMKYGAGAVAAGAVGEGIVGAGAQAESIRQQTDDGRLTGQQAMLAGATGIATGVFGALGGRVAKELGIGDIDTMLAQAATSAAARKAIARAVVEGALSEGVLEEMPQSVYEQVAQNQALGRDLMDGVDDAIVMGTLAGAAMGGPAAGVNAYANRPSLDNIQTGGELAPPEQPAPKPKKPSGPKPAAPAQLSVIKDKIAKNEDLTPEEDAVFAQDAEAVANAKVERTPEEQALVDQILEKGKKRKADNEVKSVEKHRQTAEKELEAAVEKFGPDSKEADLAAEKVVLANREHKRVVEQHSQKQPDPVVEAKAPEVKAPEMAATQFRTKAVPAEESDLGAVRRPTKLESQIEPLDEAKAVESLKNPETATRLVSIANKMVAQDKKPGKKKQSPYGTPDETSDDAGLFIAKHGGINREDALAQGVDPAAFKTRIGGRYLFPKTGGKKLGHISEALRESMYLEADGNDSGALDVVFDILRGNKVYSTAYDVADIANNGRDFIRENIRFPAKAVKNAVFKFAAKQKLTPEEKAIVVELAAVLPLERDPAYQLADDNMDPAQAYAEEFGADGVEPGSLPDDVDRDDPEANDDLQKVVFSKKKKLADRRQSVMNLRREGRKFKAANPVDKAESKVENQAESKKAFYDSGLAKTAKITDRSKALSDIRKAGKRFGKGGDPDSVDFIGGFRFNKKGDKYERPEWLKPATEEDARVFLSAFPEGVRYSDTGKLPERIRELSNDALHDIGRNARGPRIVKRNLGVFSAYLTRAKQLPGGILAVEFYGKEQVDAGLTKDPALTVRVNKSGGFTVNGPPADSVTFKEFQKRGWADYATQNDEPSSFWTTLKGKNKKPLESRQVLEILADMHARARVWKGDDKIGLSWQRHTGAKLGKEGAIFLSKKSPLGFYSGLLDAAENLKQEKGTPEQMLSMLQKGGAKTAEIDAIGLFDYLKLQGKSVTKQQIISFIENNGVGVTETILGEESVNNAHEKREFERGVLRRLGYDIEREMGGDFIFIDRSVEDRDSEEAIIDYDDLPEEAQIAASNFSETFDGDADSDAGDTKYSSYQLPGGKKYKELLLTLPDGRDRVKMKERLGQIADEMADTTPERYAELHAERANLSNDYTRDSGNQFKSSHFDQPNILAHIRFNERIDADGKKVLFIEEIQSDWAQQGRKKGFEGDGPVYVLFDKDGYLYASGDEAHVDAILKEDSKRGIAGNTKHDLNKLIAKKKAALAEAAHARDELATKHWDLRQALSKMPGYGIENERAFLAKPENAAMADKVDAAREELEFASKAESAISKEIKQLKNADDKVVQGPFVKNTDAWVSLAMKRMITYAAENGFDRVAWTTGKQNADRYSLSNKVSLAALATRKGKHYLVLEDKDGNEISGYKGSGKEVTAEELEETIGKDLAKKLIEGADKVKDQPWTSKSGVNPEFFEVRGVDLDVGGEGMKAFYDSIVPKVASKIIGKMGGKLTSVSLDSGKTIKSMDDAVDDEDIEYAREAAIQYLRGEIDARQFVQDTGLDITEDELNGALGDRSDESRYEDIADNFAESVRRHSSAEIGRQQGFDITDKMREQVSGKGLPLFKKGSGSGVDAAQLKAAIKKMAPALADHVRVVQSYDDLPQSHKDFFKRQGENPSKINGYYTKGAGKALGRAYVIADNVDSVADGVRTAVHEAAGHKALHKLLGEDGSRLYRSIYRSKGLADIRKSVDSKYKEERKAAFESGDMAEYEAWMGEEILAELAEQMEYSGNLPQSKKTIFEKIVAAFRKLLQKHLGLTYTREEAITLMVGARRSLEADYYADRDAKAAAHYIREEKLINGYQNTFDFDNVVVPGDKETTKEAASDNWASLTESKPTRSFKSKVDRIRDEIDALTFARDAIGNMPDEIALVIMVDDKGAIVETNYLSKGTIDAASVYPTRLTGWVASNKKATGVYFAHNHPSGVSSPSSADRRVTLQIHDQLEKIGVPLLNSLVVGQNEGSAFFDKSARDPNYDIKIPYRYGEDEALEGKDFPLSERVYVKNKKINVEMYTAPAQVRAAVTKNPINAIYLLDNRHGLIGTLPLTDKEMKALGANGVTNKSIPRRILAAIADANAAAVFVTVSEFTALEVGAVGRTLTGFLGDTGLLDIVGPNDSTGYTNIYSAAETGIMDEKGGYKLARKSILGYVHGDIDFTDVKIGQKFLDIMGTEWKKTEQTAAVSEHGTQKTFPWSERVKIIDGSDIRFSKKSDTGDLFGTGDGGIDDMFGGQEDVIQPEKKPIFSGKRGTEEEQPDLFSTDSFRFSKKSVDDALEKAIPAHAPEKAERLKKRIASGYRRWFTKEGGLPDSFFQAKIEGIGRNSALIDVEARYQAARFRNAVEEAYKMPYRKLTPEQKAKMNLALQGQDVAIPDAARVAIAAMRDSLDKMSNDLVIVQRDMVEVALSNNTPAQRAAFMKWIVAGADPENAAGVSPEVVRQTLLAKKIQANKGTYVNRSYQAFDDADWMEKVLENGPVISRAVKYLESEGDTSPMATIKVILTEAKTKATPLDFIATEGKRLGIFKQRKDIHPAIRDLLGEYKEPLLNYERSLSKMANIISNHHALMKMRTDGLEAGILSKKPTAEKHVEIPGGERLSPLSNLYANPELAQAIDDYTHKEVLGGFMRLVGWYNSMVKTGKTVYSPKTQARNLISNVALAVANAHINPEHLEKAIRMAVLDTYKPAEMQHDFIFNLAERGVIKNSAINRELLEQINDALGGKEPSGIGRLLGVIAQISQATYGLSDDIWKINSYLHEIDRAKAKGLAGEAAEKEAAARTVNMYPTYTMIPRAMDKLRRLPVGPSFVAWPWEILRTTKNQAGYIAKDWKEGHKKDAAERLVGNLAATAFFFTLAKMSLSAMGLDDDDDEALKAGQPPFRKHSQIYYYADENGNLRGTDLSAYDPRANITKVLKAAASGNGAPYEAIKELLNPFIGVQIGTNAIAEAYTGTDSMGNRIWNDGIDSDSEIAQKAILHIVKGSEPGVVSLLEDAYKSQADDINPTLEKLGWDWAMAEDTTRSGRKFTGRDAGLQLLGFSSFAADPKRTAQSLGYRYADARNEASRQFMHTMTGGGTLQESKIKAAVAEYKESVEEARSDIRGYTKAMEKSNLLKKSDIFATLSPVVGKDETASILFDQPVLLKNERLKDIAEGSYKRAIADGKSKEEASAEVKRRLKIVTGEFYGKK
jgi:hypothetical protein